jgi:type IV fimbrial biogenesis protein FimT
MLNRSLPAKLAGFSLIELMVGIVIFSLTLSMGISSYQTWMQNTQIRNAAESIKNGLQRARAEAVQRNINVTFTLGTNTDWTVSASGVPAIDSRSSNEGSRDVTRTVTPAAATKITYSSMGLLTPNADASASITQIDFRSSNLASARNLRITINATGGSKMCDPNLPTGSIGACL